MPVIAVAICNEKLADHFGDAALFAVFRATETALSDPILRPRPPAGPRDRTHAAGEGGHHQILMCLSGCDVVISGGMGHRIAAALESAGITPVVTSAQESPAQLCREFLLGTLVRDSIHPCCHSH